MQKKEPKYETYQDYVIQNGEFVGDFEQMYCDHEDPWEQTTREEWSSEKLVMLNLIQKYKISRVMELGCGLGYFTNKISALGVEVLGVDVSETAIKKARKSFPNCLFKVGDILDIDLYREFSPNMIIMAEITWYVLEKLNKFQELLTKEFPGVYLGHLLTTYPKGVQKYGAHLFTNLQEIMQFFSIKYLEWGEVSYLEMNGCKRTYFLGRV